MDKAQVENVKAHGVERQVKVKHIDFVFPDTTFESQPSSKVLLREHLCLVLTFA